MLNKTDFNSLTQQLIESFAESQMVYANSLILTIFGDFICSHGGTIWLGSLIKMVSPLGINQRLVRTSVFRLAENGILQSQQVGRRSYYSLTEKGFRQFSTAAERIYRHHETVWDGEWRLVFTAMSDLSNEDRERLQKELVWMGFSRFSNGIYGHPTASIDEVKQIVSEIGIEDSIVIMQAQSKDHDPVRSSTNLIQHYFSFDMMKQEYQDYIDEFTDILAAAEKAKAGTRDEELCFLLRVLLIHKFRRILLREPELPHELIPADCLSHRARSMTETLYKSIYKPADDYFLRIGESVEGKLPRASKEFYTRFGGL